MQRKKLGHACFEVGTKQKVTMAASVPWFLFVSFFWCLAISFMYDTLDEESGVLAQCYDDLL